MAVEMPSASNPIRRRALWGALGLVLMLCAWFAVHDDQDGMTDIAHPLTHAASGATSTVRSGSSGTDPARERRILASIAQALNGSSARTDFPALTDIGRRGWTSVALPAPASSASPLAVVATNAPPTFPYQWVGLWTQPGKAPDGTDTQPMAIIAGPHSTWMVKQGDLLDEDWKIASISAGQIQVIHLPTTSRQTISMSTQ